jgi:hypothetical protein
MRSRLLILVLAGMVLSGCSRGVITDDDLPTAPTPQPPRATRLTVTPLGGGNILVGATAPVATSGGMPTNGVALGAFVEFSNGQGRYVEAAWTSSDESVAAIVNNMLVARKRGTAVLTATFEGQSDSEEFTVDGGFIGRWSGTYVVERCVANSGSLQDVLCRPPGEGRAGIMPVGATLPFALEISEAGGDDITGRVFFGMVNGVLAGKNRGGGYFYLAGEIAGQGGAINIVDWNMRASRDVMEGVLAYQVKLDGLPGIGTVGARLANMTRQ